MKPPIIAPITMKPSAGRISFLTRLAPSVERSYFTCGDVPTYVSSSNFSTARLDSNQFSARTTSPVISTAVCLDLTAYGFVGIGSEAGVGDASGARVVNTGCAVLAFDVNTGAEGRRVIGGGTAGTGMLRRTWCSGSVICEVPTGARVRGSGGTGPAV